MLRSWTQILSIYVKKLGKETQVCGTKIGGGGDGGSLELPGQPFSQTLSIKYQGQ